MWRVLACATRRAVVVVTQSGHNSSYGVSTVSRIDKIIGFFRKRAL